MSTRLVRIRWVLLGALAAGLTMASVAGASHGPSDAVTALHLGVTNTPAGETILTTSAGRPLHVFSTANGGTALAGEANSGAARGVSGFTTSGTAGAFAIRGDLNTLGPGSGSAGVYGESDGQGANGAGVWGRHTNAAGTAPAVLGTTSSVSDLAAGVKGEAPSGSLTAGVYGSSSAFGVFGIGSAAGVLGYNPAGLAGYFIGNAHVTGTLTKGAGAFRIDHPLDPANKYLQHSFVESPDMKNVYDGVVRTNAKGFATVRLPRYFSALNRDFRYQLTSLSGLQEVAVAREIRGNRFVVQSEKPRSRVSWQVTGIRKDAYANANRIQPELAKAATEPRRDLGSALFRRLPQTVSGPFGSSAVAP